MIWGQNQVQKQTSQKFFQHFFWWALTLGLSANFFLQCMQKYGFVWVLSWTVWIFLLVNVLLQYLQEIMRIFRKAHVFISCSLRVLEFDKVLLHFLQEYVISVITFSRNSSAPFSFWWSNLMWRSNECFNLNCLRWEHNLHSNSKGIVLQ